MREPLRSQYLAALGIENYVPRFVLPGAKLSQPCAWVETLDEVVQTEAVNKELIAPCENIFIEKAPPEIPLRSPVELTAKRVAPLSEKAGAKSTNANAAVEPKFALSIVLAGDGLLLIDSAPASNADRSAYQKLLNNMLPALRPAAAQYVLDIFLWPLTQQSKIPRDANAARETLAAYLHKQIHQRAIDTVLLLGDAAQQWCVLESDVRIVKSTSLLACVSDPALKRPLWNDIRHLGGPGPN